MALITINSSAGCDIKKIDSWSFSFSMTQQYRNGCQKPAFLFIMNFQILVLRVGLGPGD